MRKSLKYLNILLGVAGLLGCSARPAHAQFIGYVSPQTIQQNLTPNPVTCTGGSQIFPVTNAGQTQHSFFATPTGTTSFSVTIYGVDAAGNLVQISDSAYKASGAIALQASGYFPIVEADVNCSPNTATFSLTYSGASATNPVNDGNFLQSHAQKGLFYQAAGNTTETASISTPYLDSAGVLTFTYVSGAVSGSTLAVQCQNLVGHALETFSYSLANQTASQSFAMPPSSCPIEVVTYTNGGAAGQIDIEQTFFIPGSVADTHLGAYTHITGTTATSVKATGGTLLALIVNTPAAGTVSLFDLASASCTGTPSTNVVAVITATATAPIATIPYDVQFLNGICVKASATMDLTVSSQ